MKQYIYVGIGGFFGAVARYSFPIAERFGYGGSFPLDTFLINVSGSFLIALILTFSVEWNKVDPALKVGITTGFLGAYTTFSTLCKEAVYLMQNGDYGSALFYIAASTLLGLGSAYMGAVIARNIVVNSRKEPERDSFGLERDEE